MCIRDRVYEDAEPRTYKLSRVKKLNTESWYQVSITIHNLHTIYRFVFIGDGKYEWLNAYGLSDHEEKDTISKHPPP